MKSILISAAALSLLLSACGKETPPAPKAAPEAPKAAAPVAAPVPAPDAAPAAAPAPALGSAMSDEEKKKAMDKLLEAAKSENRKGQ